jgi:hypothetical protein
VTRVESDSSAAAFSHVSELSNLEFSYLKGEGGCLSELYILVVIYGFWLSNFRFKFIFISFDFYVIRTVIMTTAIFWDVTPYSPVEAH